MRIFLDANILFTAAHNPNGKAALVIELGRSGASGGSPPACMPPRKRGATLRANFPPATIAWKPF